MDPAGGELTLDDPPERTGARAVGWIPKPTRQRNSMLSPEGELRLAEMFSAASRKHAHDDAIAEWNVRHRLHINLPQQTLEQCWN